MEIKAVVQKVVSEGKHGPFAVATSETVEGSITFSLNKSVWHESDLPKEGTMVMLSGLRKKRAGWRAMSGRFYQPSDEQTETKKKERRKEMKEKLEELQGRKRQLDEVVQKAKEEMHLLPEEFYNTFIQTVGNNDFIPVFGAEVLENTDGTLAEKWGVEANKPTQIGDGGPQVLIICPSKNPLVTIPQKAALNQVFTTGRKTSLEKLYKKYGLDIEVLVIPEQMEELKKTKSKLIKCVGFCSSCYSQNFYEMREMAEKLAEAGKVVELDDEIYTPVGNFSKKVK